MSDEMDLFQKTILSDKIKLEPADLSKHLLKIIPKKLDKKLTGQCTKHGLIKQKSIEIITICPGVVEINSLNGDCTFGVVFQAELCNPAKGSYLYANVKDVSNKFAVMAVKGYHDTNNNFHTVLKFVIPKNPIGFQNEINLDKLQINDNILIEVVDKRNILGNTTIDIIGRSVQNKKSIPKIVTDVDNLAESDSDSEKQDVFSPEDEFIAQASDTSVQDGGESSIHSGESDENLASDAEQDFVGEDTGEKSQKLSHFFDDDDEFFGKNLQSSDNDSELYENDSTPDDVSDSDG